MKNARMAHPIMFDDDDPLLVRLRILALAFPDAAEKVSHGRPAFYTTKVFAYYGGSIKIDGTYQQHPSSLLVLPDRDEAAALLQEPRAYRPAYLGASGWVGVDLDRHTGWDEVAELVENSYRNTAGPKRIRMLDTAAGREGRDIAK